MLGVYKDVNWIGREKEILAYRLMGNTLEKTGKHFGTTRERIRQVELKAWAKIRRYHIEEYVKYKIRSNYGQK